MANKGSTRHMKSIAAPKYFGVQRKANYYVLKPNPGRHTLQTSVAIEHALKKMDIASTKGEAGKLLKSGAILVNGRAVSEPKYPVGLNDVIELPKEHKSYSAGIDALGKIKFEETSEKSRLLRVLGKYRTKKGSLMARLHDGSNVVASNDIHVNDSVVLENGKIKKVMQMRVGAECTVIGGVHVGTAGKIKEIKKGSMNIRATVLIAPGSGDAFETLVKNIMVNG